MDIRKEMKKKLFINVITQPPFYYGFGFKRFKIIKEGFKTIDDKFAEAEKKVKDSLNIK